jgi:very-short-patch-repair endonuclease
VPGFFCAEIKLAIELDGLVHTKIADLVAARERVLEAGGITVLRFTNDMVLNDVTVVVQRIVSLAAQLREKQVVIA